MRNIVLSLCLVILLSFCSDDDRPDWKPPLPSPVEIPFYIGMDLSYQSFLKAYDVRYYDDQDAEIPDLFAFVGENGVNLVRVRLFHTPDPSDPVLSSSDLESVLALCREINDAGIDIMLNIHYSDTWADPGHQTVPEAWQGLSFDDLADSVYNYTRQVLNRMEMQNTLPAIVQLGNETNSGFIWDHGKLWQGAGDNLVNYTALLNSAEKAISDMEVLTDSTILTMVHYAGTEGAEYFFRKIIENNARFDLVGISYYFLYHSKNLGSVENALSVLASEFNRPVLVAETTYPFTLEWNDQTHNVAGLEEQLIPGYPATPEGQKAYFTWLASIMKAIPGEKGAGFVWWAPDLVAFDGPGSTSGSAFENLAAWDFSNKALPVFNAFKNQ